MSSKSIARNTIGLAALSGAAVLAYACLPDPGTSAGARRPTRPGALPGDQLVDNPRFVSTRRHHQGAGRGRWPWLVQLGYGRGGFYSYDWLENLLMRVLGGTPGYRSVERILPAFQQLSPGEFIRPALRTCSAARGRDGPWRVEAVIPGRSVVLRGWGAFVQPSSDTTD